MNILGNLKNLISGTRAVPVGQAPISEERPEPKIFTTIEESQNNKIEAWKRSKDIVKGLKFSATMQLRTPLRVLLRHGEIHTDMNTAPPEIAQEMWEGIWTLKTKTYRELGIDIDDIPPGAHASSIGPILTGDYLPFLIAIWKIVELKKSIESRIDKLSEMLSTCDRQEFIDKHGGLDGIVQTFFPKFMNLAAGLDTPTYANATADIAEAFSYDLSEPGTVRSLRINEVTTPTELRVLFDECRPHKIRFAKRPMRNYACRV